ncbi:hypothetical protein Tco_1272477 [Tanacetum coccineum]
MADSWKAMELNKFIVKDDMIDYVLHMYGSNWQVHDAIADDILDDLLKREWEKQKRVKYDKIKVTQMKIRDLLEKRIEKAGQHLNKEKQKMHINKGKEKMMMERGQTTSDESSDHNPFQATFDESYDHNPFQVTSGDTSDDTLKSSSEDTYSSDSVTTWQQILNKEFGMKSSKENVGGSSNVRMKGAFGSGFTVIGCVGFRVSTKGALGLTEAPLRGHLRGVHIHYFLGVLGGDTYEGYIFITDRVFLEGTPTMGTYAFHYCPGVLGGDTYDR